MTLLFPVGVLVASWFLAAVALPPHLQFYWPHWIALGALWFVLHAPNYAGVMIAWCVGLSLDLLTGAPLASNAFGLALAVHLAGLFRRRIQHLSWSQQIVVAVVFCWIALQGAVWMRWLVGQEVNPLMSIPISLVSGAIWPLYSSALKRLLARTA